MATSHHGDDGPKAINELLKRFKQQQEGTAPREYPAGRLDGSDDGALALMVAADPATGTVVIDFGKPVKWIGLKPADVAGLVKLLAHHARNVATEPFTIDLGS